MVDIEASWKQHLEGEFTKPYFIQLTESVRNEYRNGLCFPPGKLVFNAFNLCPFDKVKVVILGQDPYHEQGQAMGLSFSVPEGIMLPPSLQNIYKEIQNDLGKPIPVSGKTRRVAAECHADGACAYSQQSSNFGLAELHRRRYRGSQCPSRTRCLYALGWFCPLEKAIDRCQSPLYYRIGAPFSAVGK